MCCFFTKLNLKDFYLKRCHTVYTTKDMFRTCRLCHFGYHNVMSHKIVKKNDLFKQPFNWMTET